MSGDQKISERPEATIIAGEDYLVIVDDPSGTPTTKRVTLNGFLGALPANTVVNAHLNVANGYVMSANGGTIVLSKSTTVASNNATTVFGSGRQGSLAWDSSYLYVAVSNTQIKRVALSVFTP